MNTYVVLLRRMAYRTDHVEDTPLDARVIGEIAMGADVHLEKFLVTAGVFDAVIVCRAANNRAMGRLLDALHGWHTEALIATHDVRFETIPLSS